MELHTHLVFFYKSFSSVARISPLVAENIAQNVFGTVLPMYLHIVGREEVVCGECTVDFGRLTSQNDLWVVLVKYRSNLPVLNISLDTITIR